nr:E-beta-farnesene synthase [Tanacetum cinerariifolium]
MFHLRPDSPLHLPNEEPVLGYLKFSAKGTRREVFGMPIPGSIITAEIQQASYYREYLAKEAQHRRYLAGETGGVQDPPAPKPTQPTRKPKSTAPKAPPRLAVLTPVTSAQPAPTSAPAKPREKKRKQATETSDKPPKEKKSKYGLVLEESMKTTYALPRGPFPPVVIREPESGKYQPLLEVPGKGKAKVTEEETGPDAGAKDEGQAASNPDETFEGQAGSNPNETSEGQAGPDPGNAGAKVLSIPSPVVHAGSDCEHMNLDVADVSPQPSTEQLDEGFTATAYPKVQESLKLVVEEHVLLEEPASSSGTLSSLQHLSKDISFGDLFFSDRPLDVDKNAETKVESMVNVIIQQAMSSISLMTSPIIDLTSRPESLKEHQQLKATTTDTTTTTTTPTLPPPPAQQQSTAQAVMVSIALSEVVTDAVDWAMQAPLRNRFRDLPEADIKEILHQRMWETESYKSHEDHMQLFEALEKSMNHDHSKELVQDLAEARKKKKKSREPSRPPGAFGSSQVPPPPPPPPPSTSQENLEMDEDMGPDERPQLLDDKDTRNAHIPMVNLRQGWWKPFEQERPTTLKPAWSIWSSDVPVFHPDVLHLQYQMEECHKLLTDSVDNPILGNNVSKSLPLGGPPGDHNAVRTHMRILSVVRIKVFSMYGYDYMKKIVLRRVDLNEHVIVERDFNPRRIDDGIVMLVLEARGIPLSEDGNPVRANIKQALANELTYAFGKPFKVLNNVFKHWVFNSLVHSFRTMSALRRSGLRTASTDAKPCQGDSLEFYLITGRILTVVAAGQKDVNSQPFAHTSNSLSMKAKRPTTQLPQL